MPTPHDLDRLERARTVTANYIDSKGLYTVLMGLFLISMTLLIRDGNLEPLFLSLPVIIVLSLLLRTYYRWRFGDVRPLQTPQRIFMRTMLPVLVVLGYLLAIIIAGHLGVIGPWLFAVLLIISCLTMLGSSWRARVHYMVSAALLAAFILVPLGALTTSGVHPMEWEYPNMVALLLGILFVVNGLLDHRTLVRTLPPVAEPVTENRTD